MKSIQNKILSVVISGLLVITTIVTIISVTMTHQVMHKDADRILNNATQREAAYINDVLGDMVKSCTIMKHYALSELHTAQSLRDEAYRAEYLSKMETMFAEVAVNTEGIEGFYLRLDPKWTDGTTGFYKKQTDSATFENMPVTDLVKYGREDSEMTGWYYAAADAKEGIWLDPYDSHGSSHQQISYVQPVYMGGDLVGVVGFDINFSYLLERVQKIAVYEDGYAILVDKDGTTRYNEPSADYKEHYYALHHSDSEASAELENGMFLVMHAAYPDIQREILPILFQITAAFLAVLACAIVYTILVTRRIVGPLQKLTEAAQKFTEPDQNVDVASLKVDSKDEIGTLSEVLMSCFTKIREYTAYVNTLAYRDSLTGIPNHTAYVEVVKQMNRTMRTGESRFAVVMADINNLKRANDCHGHIVGNEVIICTAHILRDVFKTSQVFRISGDEFVVILQGNAYKNRLSLLKEFDEACAAAVVEADGQILPISVARGIAEYELGADLTFEEIVARADSAMYQNKEDSKSARTS